jgi:hypothetical protein
MPMETRLKRFVGLAAAMLLVKAADILTTWFYSPDFSLAINPFRALLPFWGFMVYQAIALGLLVLGMYFYLVKPFPRIADARSFSEFWGRALFGRKLRGMEWFTKLPSDWTPIGSLLGFIAVFAALPVGCVSVFSNILCRASSDYLAFYCAIGQALINGLLGLSVLVGTAAFLHRHYRAQAGDRAVEEAR